MESMHYQLNGVPLDTAWCHVLLGSNVVAAISSVEDVLEVSGRHGAIPSGVPPVYKSRSLTIQLAAHGRDQWWVQVQRVLMLATQPRLTLSRTVGDVVQQADVSLRSLSADSEVVGRYSKFTLVFDLPTVFWRGAERESSWIDAGESVLLPKPGESLLRTWWTGEPNNSPSILHILRCRQAGGLSTAPLTDIILRLPKGVTQATVTDVASGTGISWQGAASTSQYTYVSAETLDAWRATAADAWEGGTPVAGVDYPPAGILAAHPMPDQSYRLNLTMSGSTASVEARFTQQWW